MLSPLLQSMPASRFRRAAPCWIQWRWIARPKPEDGHAKLGRQDETRWPDHTRSADDDWATFTGRCRLRIGFCSRLLGEFRSTFFGLAQRPGRRARRNPCRTRYRPVGWPIVPIVPAFELSGTPRPFPARSNGLKAPRNVRFSGRVCIHRRAIRRSRTRRERGRNRDAIAQLAPDGFPVRRRHRWFAQPCVR